MSTKIRDYKKLAGDIIDAVGGKENITHVTHCATRLRLILKEIPADAKEVVSGMTGVIAAAENAGQFQVIIGTHVIDVYNTVVDLLGYTESEAAEVKKSIVNRIVETMSGVFAPFIYVLAAAGILQGILILINLAAPSFSNTGTYEVLSFMSWTPFTFLPIFIALTAAKHFNCNVYIAVLCCCALVNPTWSEMAARIADGENIKFLMFHLSSTTYTSTVLPPLFLVWILSYLEKFLNKTLPDAVKSLFNPLICLIIMVPFTMLLLGPASSAVANGIAAGYNTLVAIAPPVAAALIGGFWQVVVIFGVHWGITPVILANFANQGYDTFQVFQTCAVVAQMAAAFGVFIKSKNKEFKGVALSAGVTGIFGITEPTIYGVTLRLKKPFICACVSGAIGAVITSLFGTLQYVYAGLPGMLTIVNTINPENSTSFFGMIAGVLVSIILTIVSIQIIGFDDPKSEVKTNRKSSEKEALQTAAPKTATIVSPFIGEAIKLTDVPDEAFSNELLGIGLAVEPSEYTIYAPVDGIVESVFDTKHAIGFTADNGTELLIHIGLDTVKLCGKYFELNVKVGDRVKAGEAIGKIDGEAIKAEGYKLVTPVLVVNAAECKNVVIEQITGEIKKGQKIIETIA
ncbi:MAG: beta-glucoside-specific PTS transporter subunit IIABC [Lachnospiraceae bacterium]|nr:beta-glucoside-specific PTS transporter subunit IIABC [Lachnospiraceae bacterium]